MAFWQGTGDSICCITTLGLLRRIIDILQ